MVEPKPTWNGKPTPMITDKCDCGKAVWDLLASLNVMVDDLRKENQDISVRRLLVAGIEDSTNEAEAIQAKCGIPPSSKEKIQAAVLKVRPLVKLPLNDQRKIEIAKHLQQANEALVEGLVLCGSGQS